MRQNFLEKWFTALLKEQLVASSVQWDALEQGSENIRNASLSDADLILEVYTTKTRMSAHSAGTGRFLKASLRERGRSRRGPSEAVVPAMPEHTARIAD